MSAIKRATRVTVVGNVIEVTPGDDVNPKTLAVWVAERVTLPDVDGLVMVRVTSWFARWVEPTPAEPHPAPEVPCRPAEEHEIPRAAILVRRKAEAAGWTVRPTYARGTRQTKAGAGKVVDSLALRMRHPDRRALAVAVWHDGRFDCAYHWQYGQLPVSVGATELAAWLAS